MYVCKNNQFLIILRIALPVLIDLKTVLRLYDLCDLELCIYADDIVCALADWCGWFLKEEFEAWVKHNLEH